MNLTRSVSSQITRNFIYVMESDLITLQDYRTIYPITYLDKLTLWTFCASLNLIIPYPVSDLK